jgi:CBS-domain-containing membrane protein
MDRVRAAAAGALNVAKRAADVMDPRVVVAHWHESADTALDRLDDPAPAVLVVDGDRVVAVVERERLRRELTEARGRSDRAHLRDLVAPPVWYCQTDDDLGTARSTLGGATTEAIAVVDTHRRVVGVLTTPMLGEAPPGEAARPATDPSDRGDETHPKLHVYAPWVAIGD